METEHTVLDGTSEENSLDKVLHSETHQETEIERLVRLGEMTPFGSKVASYGDNDSVIETDQLKHTGIDGTKHGDDTGSADQSGGRHNIGDIGLSTLKNPVPNKDDPHLTLDFDGKANIRVVDSDEDYIPDEEELKLSFRDDEHFLPKGDSVEPMDEVTIATKKTRSPKKKVAKKTNRVYQSVKDDGDDRTYQIRIRYGHDAPLLVSIL
ncbi:Hypothetical predicted protein [Paramuricea clavata]|nr:Hypothetical predicted protein [Paramuricea clavata]